MNYWLMKSEPETFSIDDLKSRPNKTECWDGVRNYQARNMMRDEMKKGDLVFFYHSNCTPPGIVGIAKVVSDAYPDHTQFQEKSKYFDPKAAKDHPRWFMVDIKFVKKFKTMLPLETLKAESHLAKLPLVKRGSRLSIMPVDKKEWEHILKMAGESN